MNPSTTAHNTAYFDAYAGRPAQRPLSGTGIKITLAEVFAVTHWLDYTDHHRRMEARLELAQLPDPSFESIVAWFRALGYTDCSAVMVANNLGYKPTSGFRDTYSLNLNYR